MQLTDRSGSEGDIMTVVVRDALTSTERKIAIKCYKASTPAQNIDAEQQLLAELQGRKGIARLALCPPLTWGPYLAMEYAEHGDLCDFLFKVRDKTLSPPLTRYHVHEIFSQLLHAVDEIFSIDYIHRDIKPDNILVYTYSETKIEIGLADFGLAVRRNTTAHVAGSAQYLHPNMAKRTYHTYRGFEDMYALGTTLVLIVSLLDETAYAPERALADTIRRATPDCMPEIMAHLKAMICSRPRAPSSTHAMPHPTHDIPLPNISRTSSLLKSATAQD